MTTKELQENVLSRGKNIYNRRTYFYLFFDENRQIGFPIIFNHNYCNFRTKFRGLSFSNDYSWAGFYCVGKNGKEIYSAYFEVSDKEFLKEAIECFSTIEAELIVSLKQGGIFSSNCCFANFGNAMPLGLNEFLDATGQPDCGGMGC